MRGLIAVAIATAPNATHTAAANPSLMYMHHSYQNAYHPAGRGASSPSRPHAANARRNHRSPTPIGTHHKIPPVPAGFL